MAQDPIEDPESLAEMPAPDSPVYRYLKPRLLQCVGDGVKLPSPVEVKMSGRSFAYDGDTLRLQGEDPDGQVVLGVLGAIKDFSRETRAALDFYLDRFEQAKVDALVLNGDLAATEFEITQVVLHCAKRGWPTLVLIGNTEGRTAFNRALLSALKVSPNVINFDFVRLVDLGGATLVSLPGYLDRKFVHQSGGCSYKPREVDELSRYTDGARGAVVVVSHGPPAGSDPNALDTAVEAGNVGDARLAGFLREQKIPFGLFGHILEAGGRAIDAAGQPVRQGQWIETAFLNVGSANPLPWQLNGGKLSCGMAAILKIKAGKGWVEFIEQACR
jgi:Icc-related predicted phosphoesterase